MNMNLVIESPYRNLFQPFSRQLKLVIKTNFIFYNFLVKSFNWRRLFAATFTPICWNNYNSFENNARNWHIALNNKYVNRNIIEPLHLCEWRERISRALIFIVSQYQHRNTVIEWKIHVLCTSIYSEYDS